MFKVNPEIIKDIKKYGALEITSCFNCGTCTAICPLSKEDSAFPRKLIRYANLGMKDKLLASKEMWMCYYCGECSKTCPREAKPAAFMAAARRYAIAKADITGLTGLLYKWPVLNFLIMTIVAFLLGMFMYGQRVEHRDGHKIIEVFNIPFSFIHDLGLGVILVAVFVFFVGGLITFFRSLEGKVIVASFLKKDKKGITLKAVKEAFKIVVDEMLVFKRFKECDAEAQSGNKFLLPSFLHSCTAWGFMGLFGATILDFLFKDPQLLVSLWYPPRLLGTISGIFLIYGTTGIIIKRLLKNEVPYSNSTFSDWWFILVLWFIGVTGFILEVLVYLPKGSISQKSADVLFVIHVAPAMELVVMAAFTKLAHVVYRPLALFSYNLKNKI